MLLAKTTTHGLNIRERQTKVASKKRPPALVIKWNNKTITMLNKPDEMDPIIFSSKPS